MATNQRAGIIAKYAKEFGPILQNPFGASTSAGLFSSGSGSTSASASGSFFSGMPSLPSIPSFSSMPSIPSFSGMTGISTTSSGGYALQFFFYFFLYGLIVFLILLLVHYAVYPIFQFVPGGKGVIPILTTNDYSMYWNAGIQPITAAPDSRVTGDSLINYKFERNYSVSIDICLTDLTGKSGLDRLIFYSSTSPFDPATSPLHAGAVTNGIATQFASNPVGVSMICYVDDNTNDVIVTYFLKASDGSTVQRSSFPIQNIPLYTPFRIMITYDTNIFTVYYNGLQVSQTSVGGTNPINSGQKQVFYANTRTGKCGYVQTMMLWARAVHQEELAGVKVALTPIARFKMPKYTPGSGPDTCGSTMLTDLTNVNVDLGNLWGNSPSPSSSAPGS